MSTINRADVVLCIGTNRGKRLENFQFVKKELLKCVKILEVSRILENKPEEFDSDQLFFNQLLKISTELNPFELLFELKKIEGKMGRKHKSIDNKYFDRVIDVDIILYKGLKINSGYLYLPHTNNIKRRFYNKLIKDLN